MAKNSFETLVSVLQSLQTLEIPYMGVEKVTGPRAREARAAVSADYGILWMYPTTALIDASGIVVGRFDAADSNDVAKLKKLLDTE